MAALAFLWRATVPTLQAARRWLSRSKIRRYRQITTGVQATPPNGSYVGVAGGDLTTSGDNIRAIVSSDLASQNISDGDDVRSDLYDGWYGYALTTNPEQRRISLDGFTPHVAASSATDQVSTVQVGYLIAERNYGAAIPASTVVELHAHPPLDADGAPGLHFFINQALKGMRGMTRRISIVGTSAQAYSLAAYGISRQWQLAQVLGQSYTSGLEPYSAGGSAAQLRTDGNVTYLVFTGGAPVTGTFYADLWLPRDAWIAPAGSGSVFALSTTGLVSELDECTGDINEIALVAYYHYCMYRAEGPHGLDAEWERRASKAAQIAAPFLEHGSDMPIDAWSGGRGLIEQGGAGSDWGIGGGTRWP